MTIFAEKGGVGGLKFFLMVLSILDILKLTLLDDLDLRPPSFVP